MTTQWETTSLGNLAQYVNGRGFKKSEWREEGIPIIRIQNLTGSTETVNYFNGELEEKHHVRKGDLLLSWAATLDVYEFNENEGALNQHIFKVIPKPNVDQKFLYYLLKNKVAELYAQTHGSGMVHITAGKFKSTPARLPGKPEQKEIAAKIEELFSEIDNTEMNLHKSSALLRSYWSAAFEQLYKDEGEAVLLSECIELSQNGLAKRNSKSGIDYKVLRLADIKDKSITEESARYIKLDHKEIEKYKLLADDLVAIRVNGSRDLVGNLIYYPKDDEWAYCDHFIRLRARSGVLHPLYLKYYFETQFVKNYLKQKMVSTAGQNTISQGSLLSLSIPMVPLEKQTEIVMIAKEIESELLSLNKQITNLLKQCKTNKQTILSKAFKGELV